MASLLVISEEHSKIKRENATIWRYLINFSCHEKSRLDIVEESGFFKIRKSLLEILFTVRLKGEYRMAIVSL